MARKSNGEGSYRKLKSGTWIVQYMDGYKENGKRNIVSFSAPTKAEARQKLLNYQQAAKEGATYIDQDMGFAQWADLWYQGHRTQVAASTFSNYQYTLKTLTAYFGDCPLHAIKQLDVNRFLEKLSNEGYSKSKITKCKTMLIQIFTAAEDNDLITKNPALRSKAAKHPDGADDEESAKDAFSVEEIELLIDNLKNDLLGNSILAMIGSGMRVQELLALKKESIAADGSVIHIRNAIKMVDGKPVLGAPKSRRSRRDIPIPEDYRFFVKQLRALGGDTYIWESTREDLLYSVGSFRRRYRTALKKIPGVRLLTPHCCRHTYITRLQENGVPIEIVARLAGHSKIETTDKYTHTSLAFLAESVKALNQTKTDSKASAD